MTFFLKGLLFGFLLGGSFLLYLGVKTLFSRPESTPSNADSAGLAQGFLSTLGLTLANPPTILGFAVWHLDTVLR